MPEYLKDRVLTQRNNEKFTNLKKSMPGQQFIDFNGKTIDDKDVMLSDYIGKGKYVLLDFWASWCGPCKEVAKRIIYPLYEKYKDDDRFLILGIATWEKKEATLKGLAKLQYPWPQIFDVKQIPMELYGFDSIPQLLLIDPDGIIMERWDLHGSKLLETIYSILSKNTD